MVGVVAAAAEPVSMPHYFSMVLPPVMGEKDGEGGGEWEGG